MDRTTPVAPAQHYKERQISPHFWPNGKLPVREDWNMFVETEFLDYKLKIGGLVENPVELSLPQLADLGIDHTITMHHCIQGWSGIAEWNGVSMKKLIDLVRPLPVVKAVAFYSFGEALYGGTYYETQRLASMRNSSCDLTQAKRGTSS